MRRTRESLPFGGQIKKAAFKAAFKGVAAQALLRYCIASSEKKSKIKDEVINELDYLDCDSLLDDDSDESVS